MATFEEFKIWYADSLGSNSFANADADKKIQNTTTAGEEISLIYCIPASFAKRATDVSEALAVDPTSPDTGTGMSDIILRFTQQRENGAPTAPTVLTRLFNMFYLSQNDSDFQKGRIGIENADNPELDCLPVALAGYKITSFRQEPNQDTPALQIWEVRLKFLGDHTKLGTRSP